MRKLIMLAFLLLLVGCPASPPQQTFKDASSSRDSGPPPKEEIENGVNWDLSSSITWRNENRSLFDTYRIINQYTENRNGWLSYVYDYEAQCTVYRGTQYNQSGGSKIVWEQADVGGSLEKHGPAPEIKMVKGSFTLIKKGNFWYKYDTIR